MKWFVLTLLASFLVAAPAAADACMQFDAGGQIAEGRLELGHFKDAADRPESAFILRVPVPACLSAADPEYRVRRARRIHIYSSDDRVRAQIGRLVGKDVLVRGRPFKAHTSHHHAPIVMDISEIDAI